jgi:hypothetical protein
MKIRHHWIFILPILLLATTAESKPVIQGIRVAEDTVRQYDKFEAQISLDAAYKNPFDPQDIDISAIFTSPSGKEYFINGFYYYNNWSSLWMVRFSPNESGRWLYKINVQDLEGSVTSDPDTFMVISSRYRGPIRVSSINNRYLEYADGTSYYGVGLWYNDNYSRFNQGQVRPEELNHLKSLGVNFISSFITPLETMGTGLGRYDQNLCGRLDELLEWCEEQEILLSLNLWFHPYLSKTVWPGGNRRWNTNPYQLVCEAEDFYSNPKAWNYQEQLYRYMIARWGYSHALAIWFIIDEVNGTDGWASGDSVGANRWAKMVHQYFKANDPYNHLTTGTRSGGIKEFWHEGYQIFDLAAREIYEAQGFPILRDGKIDSGDDHPLKLSYQNYVNEVQKLWFGYKKPVIIGETGWDHTFYEPNMPGYLAQYHNTLWSCLSCGAAMTPFWWALSPFMNDNVVNHQLSSISRFVAGIPFSKLVDVTPIEATLSNGDAFAISSKQLIFGWVVNPLTDVSGAVVTLCSQPEGEYILQLYHTWRGQFLPDRRISAQKGQITFEIPVLKIEGSHAQYVGQDMAFILRPVDKQY